MKLLMLGAAILCFSFSVRGQEWKSLSVDELFKTARQNAFDGDRLQARMKLHEILNRTPAYDEVAVFLARTFIWDGEYDSARLILQNLLSKNPHNREAMLVLSDAFGWSGNYSDALATVNVWLTSNPNDEDFLYKKGSYLKELGKNAESAAVLQTLLSIQPSHKKASELLQEFKRQNQRNAVTGSYSADIFNRTFSPAQFAYMQIARSYRWGTGMARVNFANRFTQSGTQAEFDIYPRLLKGTYGYFNYGYSSSALSPVHRIGAEFYSKLPKSLEISAGARYLNYGSSTPVIIYTGSLGWHFKNKWVSV
ncbi:MAG TPA: hypothetical protein DGG95_06570, partial [Cytophagales bacterium]|nr:hypothetical protein [Cytophagales bacterium]